ncbi:MAG: hypothetical protein LAO22_06880 [Acidobacteriia bacterium]|nr:hypothetical protein [Terriglobia bacterium]
MFQRFAASTAVASMVIAGAVLIVCFVPGLTFGRIYPLPIFWCVAPFAWGIWALLIPSAWMPSRLPLWGAILGLIAGSLAAFVLNLPSRLFGAAVSLPLRGVAVLVMVLFYYLLWMLVRAACRSLASAAPENRR